MLIPFWSKKNTATEELMLYDDGSHMDGLAQDGIWANSIAVPEEQMFYSVDVEVEDNVTGSINVEYSAAAFTTAGPLILDSLMFRRDYASARRSYQLQHCCKE